MHYESGDRPVVLVAGSSRCILTPHLLRDRNRGRGEQANV